MDRLGDVVRATAALRSLGQHFSRARVEVVAPGRSGAILEQSPWIHEHHRIGSPFAFSEHRRLRRQLQGRRYDLGVLLEVDPFWAKLGSLTFRRLKVDRWVCFDFGDGHSPRARGVPLPATGSWVAVMNQLIAATGAIPDSDRTEIHVSPEEQGWADAFLRERGVDPESPFVVLHPGGNFLTVSRQWPAESFAELVSQMSQRWPMPILVTGMEAERPIYDSIRKATPAPLVDLIGCLNLRQLAAVLAKSSLCIMNDTGPLHIAHALDRRTVVILGPTDPEVVGVPAHGKVVRLDLPCSPCAGLTGWKACHNPVEWECLRVLSPGAVLSGVARQLRDGKDGDPPDDGLPDP